jgi:uncharacterized protein YllA (UPF0747 family)
MQWIKALSLLKSLWDAAKTLYDYYQRRKAEARIERANKAAERLAKASHIKDANERLKEKAHALCQLEKELNPSSTCDVGPSNADVGGVSKEP